MLYVTPGLAAILTVLAVVVIGALVGMLVASLLGTTAAAKFKRILGIVAGIAVTVILGLLVWVLIISSVIFGNSPRSEPARFSSSSPASAQASGSCAASPVNPTDGEFVTLTYGNYVIEEFDNSLPVPLHKFLAYDVSQKGPITVMATATSGTRAWQCTNFESAFKVAYASAAGYKAKHPTHKVYGPDGVEVIK